MLSFDGPRKEKIADLYLNLLLMNMPFFFFDVKLLLLINYNFDNIECDVCYQFFRRMDGLWTTLVYWQILIRSDRQDFGVYTQS